MKSLHPKFVIDEHGKPQEVIIAWDEFQEIVEILGLDFDSSVLEDLQQAQQDRASGQHDVYTDVDDL